MLAGQQEWPLAFKSQLSEDSSLVGPVAEWLACWTQVQQGLVQITVAMLLGNSLRQSVHTL